MLAVILSCSVIATAVEGASRKTGNSSVLEAKIVKCGPGRTGPGCPTATDPLTSGKIEIDSTGEVKVAITGAAPAMTYRVFISSLVISEATDVATVSKVVLTNDPNQFIFWDVTSDAQAFVQGIAENNGWLIKDEAENKPDQYTTTWVSKESASNACGADSAAVLILFTNSGPISLAAQADAYIDQNSKNANNGSASDLLVRSWDNGFGEVDNLRTLIRFDLSAVPLGTAITGASLGLCLDAISGDQTARVYGIYRVTKNWVESEVTATVATATTLWDSYFGDFGVQSEFIGSSLLNGIGTFTTSDAGDYSGPIRSDTGGYFSIPSSTILIGIPNFIFSHASGGSPQFATGIEIP
jgi:hypothetical protein